MSRRPSSLLGLLGLLVAAGCALRGPARRFDVEPAAFGRGSAPILLVHGLLITGFRPIAGMTTFDAAIVAALRADGFDVWLPALPAVAPPAARVDDLLRAIDEVRARTGAARVHVVAHSQAGIDARLLLDDPRAAGKVIAVVTLSSPHDGTPMAEVARRLRGSLAEAYINRAARRIDESRGWPSLEGRLRETTAALGPERMARFNAEHPSTPVPLFSIAATPAPAADGSCDGGAWPAPRRAGRWNGFMAIGSELLDEALGGHVANDGFVPTASQRFGTFLGCAPVDHMGWLQERATGFPASRFFVELARALRDLERTGDPAAFLAHGAALGRLADGR